MMKPLEKTRVFLVGEGENELGSRAGAPAYQSDKHPGVLFTLLSRVQPNGWIVGGAREWKSIRKYQARSAVHEDTRHVLGAAIDAKEAGCDRIVARSAFVRDLPQILTQGEPGGSADEAGVG